MANMPVIPVLEDPLSTDAEPASHPAHARARHGRRRGGAAVARPLSSAQPASPGSTSTRRRSSTRRSSPSASAGTRSTSRTCMSKRQRPKVDDYADEGYLFGVLHFPVYDRAIQRLNAAELDIFVGPDYLVTLPTVELLPVTRLFRALRGGRGVPRAALLEGLGPPALRGARRPLRLLLPDPRQDRAQARLARGRRVRGPLRGGRPRHLERQAGDHQLPEDHQAGALDAARCSSATSSGSCPRSSSSTSTTSSTPPSASGTSSTTTRRSSRRSRTRTSR